MLSASLREKIAKRIVWGQNMKKGESLMIRGGSHEQELLEEIAIITMKQGNDIITGMGSDLLTRRIYNEISENYLKTPSKQYSHHR